MTRQRCLAITGTGALLLLIAAVLTGCGSEQSRYDEDSGRSLPVELSSSSAEGYFIQPRLEMRPLENNPNDDPVLHLSANVNVNEGFELAELGIHYQALHFDGEDTLSEEEAAEVNRTVNAVMRGEGTGFTRTYSDNPSDTLEVTMPVSALTTIQEDISEYVIVWSVSITERHGDDTLMSSHGGSFIFDGEQVYSLNITDDD